DEALLGPSSELYLSDEPGLCQAHGLLGTDRQRLAEGRPGGMDGLELVAQSLRLGARIAGADAPRVMQLTAAVIAKQQRADGAGRRRRGHVADDDEGLPQHALRLEPMLAASRPVRQIDALRYDAFEPEPAGVVEDGRSVVVDEMLAEANKRVRRQVADDVRQQRLAVEQRRLGQVEPFAVEEIEDVEPDAVLPPAAQVRLQIVEARNAGSVLDHDLAVDIGGGEAEPGERLDDAREARSPVEPGAREQLDLAAVDAGADPVAVVLDLVHPLGAARRPFAQRRETGLQKHRQQAFLRSAHRRDVRQGTVAGGGDGGTGDVIEAHVAERGQFLSGAAAEK